MKSSCKTKGELLYEVPEDGNLCYDNLIFYDPCWLVLVMNKSKIFNSNINFIFGGPSSKDFSLTYTSTISHTKYTYLVKPL